MLDKKLASLPGIAFFISCITGTTTNRTVAKNAKAAVAYFISVKAKSGTTEDVIFREFHDNNMDMNIATIKLKGKSVAPKDTILCQLKQVVKVSYLYNVCCLSIYVNYGIKFDFSS